MVLSACHHKVLRNGGPGRIEMAVLAFQMLAVWFIVVGPQYRHWGGSRVANAVAGRSSPKSG